MATLYEPLRDAGQLDIEKEAAVAGEKLLQGQQQTSAPVKAETEDDAGDQQRRRRKRAGLAVLSVFAAAVLFLGVRRPPPGHRCRPAAVAEFRPPPTRRGQCESWVSGGTYIYPEDFRLQNHAEVYKCPASGKRIIVSNGVPDHNVEVHNPHAACEVPWRVEVPLEPELRQDGGVSEPAPVGIVAMALNGVPIYGPQVHRGDNGVDPAPDGRVRDAHHWYGHAARHGDWHYNRAPAWVGPDDIWGYALDGFPIFGALNGTEAADELDECNGRIVDGQYQYHARSVDQVDGRQPYCATTDSDSAAVNWRYTVGCFRGDMSKTRVADGSREKLPSDCVRVF